MNEISRERSAKPLPYGRHTISEEDIAAVVEVLRGDWLTTGPMVERFEHTFAECVGVREAVAVSSGTAALHCMMNALEIETGDEVIVPTLTFAATANCVVYQGGRPVFVDVDPATLLIDPAAVEAAITSRTRAIIAVDYAGQPCDYDRLQSIADRRGLTLVADACHSLGACYRGRPVGSLARMSAFSFHPVKPMTTGEGGMVATNDAALAKRMRSFRNHGITVDHRQRQQAGTWIYSIENLGVNYRLTDLQCALGLSQLNQVNHWTERRQAIACKYTESLASSGVAEPLAVRSDVSHAYHLFVVRWNEVNRKIDRAAAFRQLRDTGLGVNVHYIPVHLHPFYQRHHGTRAGLCPVAEQAYEQILSLPIFATLSDGDATNVIAAIKRVESRERTLSLQTPAA